MGLNLGGKDTILMVMGYGLLVIEDKFQVQIRENGKNCIFAFVFLLKYIMI